MGQFVHNGILYEELPNGKARVVGPAQGVPQSAIGPAIGGNPMIPGQLQGQTISNEKNAALTPYEVKKAKADAAKAELDLKNAQEQYNAQHPPVNETGLFGPSYLKTLSNSDQSMVKALSEGRLAFPQGAALRAPFWQEKLSQVAQYDPTFDATNYNTRAQARVNAVKGKLGQSNNALNTAIGHLGQLSDQIGGTASHDNFPFVTDINAVQNWYERKHGDPGVTNFLDTAGKLADELEAVYRNGGGAEQGVIRQLRSLDPNMSLSQKQGIVNNAMDLLASKMAANLSQYNFGTGGKPTFDMLDQHTLQVLHDKAPGLLTKYFAPPPAGAAGGNSPPPPPGPGFTPPPTGPTNSGLTPSTNGYNETPDPQSADFWASAARQGTSYRDALHQWQSDVKFRGLVGVTPPPPDAYHKAAAYIHDHPNVPYQPFNSVQRTPIDPLQQAATDVAFSGPAVGIGHTVNSLAANIPTALAGEQGSRYNAVSDAMHGNYAASGDILGTLGGALATGGAVGKVAPSLGRFGGLIAGNPARTALTGDMLFGGASGAAQNPDNPFGGAALGAGSMALGNVAGRTVVGPAIRAALDNPLLQRGVSAAKGMFGGSAFAPPAALDSGQNLIFNRAGNLGDITNNLQDAANFSLPYALADANPKFRALAGSTVRMSANARQLAENTIGPRQMGQAERAIAQVDANLAPVGDVPTMKADAMARARAASKPLYDQAFAHPAPKDPQIMEMLSSPAGEQAARNAYDIALNSGESPGELSITIGQDGKPAYTGLPNWKTLQYIKMGMDKVVTDNANPVTGKLDLSNPANKALNDIRARFVNRLGEINPDYRSANEVYGKIAGQGTAAERGAAATGIGVTPEQAQIAVTNAGTNLPHFQSGYASALADQAERSRLTSNPYNTIYGSLGQRAKIGTVFPQGAANFARVNGLEGDMSKTAYETLGGSPTAARLEADKAFSGPNLGDTAFDLGVSAATGVPPIGLLQRGLRGLASGTKDRLNLGRGAQAKADALAPLLLNTDPHANLIMLNDIFGQGAARRAYLQSLGAASGQIGAGMFGAPILYGASQQ